MNDNKNFKRVSDAFFGYCKALAICRGCERFNGSILPTYLINDVIYTSFVIEVGFKSLLAFEENKNKDTHNLLALFELLSIEMQERIITMMNDSTADFKIKLRENSNNFVDWRYYFEIFETGKKLSNDDKFMNDLIANITLIINELKEKCPK